MVCERGKVIKRTHQSLHSLLTTVCWSCSQSNDIPLRPIEPVGKQDALLLLLGELAATALHLIILYQFLMESH